MYVFFYIHYDPRIHNFGNVGIGGKFHASLARPITKIIDIAAYNGEDIRKIIINEIYKTYYFPDNQHFNFILL